MTDTNIISAGSRPPPAEPSSFLTPFAAVDMAIGTPVFQSAAPDANTADEAKADNIDEAVVIGMLVRDVAAGERCLAQTRGPFRLTDAQWKARNSGSSLVPGTAYYLSAATAGLITATAPTGANDFVIPIGVAISVTEMLLNQMPFYQVKIPSP